MVFVLDTKEWWILHYITLFDLIPLSNNTDYSFYLKRFVKDITDKDY